MSSAGETSSASGAAILWFRRDLRLADHPAMLAAANNTDREVLALFVLDERLLTPSGSPRLRFLDGCLRELDERLGGRLLIRRGEPAEVVADTARRVAATTVHVSADAGPYGRRRDAATATALRADGVELVATGSPYAVTPGRVRKADGEPYRVFTPFRRAWSAHGWRAPADTGPDSVRWLDPPAGLAEPLPAPKDDGHRLHPPGERAARAAWAGFRDGALAGYDRVRDRPDLDGTSRLSAYLRFGCLHPRTLLAELAGPACSDCPEKARASYRSELAWREFYADVLFHQPRTARRNADRRFDALPVHDGARERADFDTWCAGRTGYPIVDAGMRQLRTEGWMHNRVRMIVASFLVKDLHLPWWWGARHFMRHLVDGDLASNQHGWQWTAGTGTDAAPYYRIFNPTTQGERFDPDGAYVRRHLPELRGIPGKAVHQPWTLSGGPPSGYPPPMVDHPRARAEALARYEMIKVER